MTQEISTPKKFPSLSQTNEFEAKYLNGRIVVSIHDSVWTIERSIMREIWNKAVTVDEHIRFKTMNYDHKNVRTLSYILALMQKFVDQNKME